MVILLLMIPVLVVISVAFLYRFNGRRQVFSFDLVQFSYAFIFGPLLLVWIKSFLYFLLKQEVGSTLSINDVFLADTAVTILMFYIAAFGVIHSLTKSFDLRKKQDPLLDIYELTEYFHHFFSHVILYLGILLIFTMISVMNLFFPVPLELNTYGMLAVMAIGFVFGLVGYLSIWMYDSVDYRKLARIMKLGFISAFALHVVLYYVLDPHFAGEHAIYWLVFMASLGASLFGFVFKRSRRIVRFLNHFNLVPKYIDIKKLYTLKKAG